MASAPPSSLAVTCHRSSRMPVITYMIRGLQALADLGAAAPELPPFSVRVASAASGTLLPSWSTSAARYVSAMPMTHERSHGAAARRRHQARRQHEGAGDQSEDPLRSQPTGAIDVVTGAIMISQIKPLRIVNRSATANPDVANDVTR